MNDDRLTQLNALRDQIDAEIQAEMQRQARIKALKLKAAAVLTRGTIATRIVNACAQHYQVSLDAIVTTRQRGDVARARAVACYLMRQHGSTWAEIAREFQRDHSTIIHAARRVEREPELKATAGYLAELVMGVAA